MAFKEDSLRNTAVLYSVLEDMEGIIIEIVVNGAFADTVVFCGAFNDWLLEVSVEMQHL